MAIDKDPSIYRDRGTIGSSDELDEYGVWVKSEPQEISSPGGERGSIIEPALPDIEDLPDLELDMDTDFGLPAMDEPMDVEASEQPSIPFQEETMDFSVEEPAGEEAPKSSFEELSSFDDEDIGSVSASAEDFTELSMDDFLDGSDLSGPKELRDEPQAEEEPLNIDLDFNEAVDLEGEIGETALSFNTASDSEDDATLKLEIVSDFDDFLDDLSTEDGEKKSESADEADEGVDLSLSGGDVEGEFDDVEALHRDLQESTEKISEKVETVAASMREPAGSAKIDLSTQLLMRIADELSSIKNEISSLKGELAVLKSEPRVEPAQESPEQGAAKGFFDEEDDEKIALTGDELDNILNTADFTEEAGADAVETEEEAFDADDLSMDTLGNEPVEAAGLDSSAFLSDQEDILSLEEPQEITVDEVLEDSEDLTEKITEDLESEIAPDLPEELERLREDGVRPMTEAPEDTSYLEDEPLDVDHIDLSEAVIDEPDLGAFVLEEAPVEEPSIEAIHIDLELEEDLHTEETASFDEEENLDEIMELPMDDMDTVLDIGNVGAEEVEAYGEESEEITPVLDESFEEVLPEGFVVGPEETEVPAQDHLDETMELMEAEEEDHPDIVMAPPVEEASGEELPSNLRQEVKTVLSYMDQLLESLPEEKIEEFAKSEYFETYKKLFEDLGLV